MSVAPSTSTLVIAWQGLPFYACRCLAEFRRVHPEVALEVVTSRSPLPQLDAERESGGRVHVVDSEKSLSFRDLGLPVPDHLFVTSWSHAAYRNLAREAKAKGSRVTVMMDNLYRGNLRQRLGSLYFRLRLRGLFDDAWVPGREGVKFARVMGFSAERVLAGLYAADPTVFFPPAAGATREGLVFVGQLIERKGVKELSQAIRMRKSSLRVSMIGEGPLRAELAAAGTSLEQQLAPRELAARLRAASALILPSRLDHWGLVLHEAALSGCILLATTTCGATADLIRHGQNGFILSKNSSAEIAQAILWLEALRPEQISHARELSCELAQQFSPTRWSKAVDSILRRQTVGN